MALIRAFARFDHQKPRVHGEVECGYAMFEEDGRRYLQLDTYGSPDRQIPGKTSQSVQLDATGARRLLDVILEAFPELR
jgi:hypothetical protein